MRKLLFVTLGLFTIEVGAEALWIALGRSGDHNTTVLIDLHSIERIYSREWFTKSLIRVSAWHKYLNTDRSYIMVYKTYYCTTKKHSSTDYTVYTPHGDIVESGKKLDTGGRIIPGTLGSLLFDKLCTGKLWGTY